ncbi:hypothetical protein GCM10027072_73780 [Streptomyces bullii]
MVVDHEPTARQNCGPLVAARAHPHAPGLEVLELRRVLTGEATGRGSDDDIVTYLSAGLGVQDAAAAWSVYQQAEARDIGRRTDWPATSASSPATEHGSTGEPAGRPPSR